MEKVLVTPQVSGAVYAGFLWGDSLQTSVMSYEGSALNIGGSMLISAEYIESVDKQGAPNGNIRGGAIGIGVGPPEIHAYYNDAIFLPELYIGWR